LPHYQPPPQKETPSPTNSPYSSVDATNHVNNNGQQSNLINNNQKYHQPPMYNGNGNGTHTNGNGVRNNVVMSASIPSGGVSATSAMQQQLQQKYYDQYESFRSNGNGVNGNGNGNHQNGMSQSAYNGTKAYAPAKQMTTSYNQQQMAYNNHYNSQQNGSNVGKIADYDPLTDGPRNVPQTQRSNQTLIYSSEQRGAAREYSDSVKFIVFFFFVGLLKIRLQKLWRN
jgi:LIM and SH3 domain protein 1